MRVKLKGFSINKCYSLVIRSPKSHVMYIYFSNKNHVLCTYYDEKNTHKRLKVTKKSFKDFLRLPYPIVIDEMDVHSFFDEFNNYRFNDNDYEYNWQDDYACENGCCSCCGCSCYYYDDDDYDNYDDYDYESEEDEEDVIQERKINNE